MGDYLKNLFDLQGENRWVVAKTSAEERIAKLQKLRKAIVKRQQEFYDAIWADFHKPKTEAWLSEIYPSLQEIDYAVKHLPDWMKDKDGSWSFLFPSNHSRSHFEPKGRVLIMVPWNYPFLLLINPIISAIVKNIAFSGMPKTVNSIISKNAGADAAGDLDKEDGAFE